MRYGSSIGVVAFSAALPMAIANATVHDETKYPDLRGQSTAIGGSVKFVPDALVDPQADPGPIADLLEQGCDLDLDILPTVARMVRPLRGCCERNRAARPAPVTASRGFS
jgi:hypothetical protein